MPGTKASKALLPITMWRAVLIMAGLVVGHLVFARLAVTTLSIRFTRISVSQSDTDSKPGNGSGTVLDWYPPGSMNPEYKIRQELMGVSGCPGVAARRYEGPVDRVEVVAIGDSYTFGVGLPPDATWPTLLERSLGTHVLNLGQPGINLERKVALYKNCARKLSPQIVLIQLLMDDWFDTNTLNRRIWPLYVRYGQTANAYKNMAEWYPPLYWSYSALQTLGFPSDDFLLYERGGAPFFLSGRSLLSAFLADREMRSDIGKDLRRLSLAQGGTSRPSLVILVMPYKEEVWWDQVVALDKRAIRFSPETFKEEVMRECANLRLECHDATEVLRERRQEGLYFRVDDHLSHRGHAVVAEWVGSILDNQATKSNRQ